MGRCGCGNPEGKKGSGICGMCAKAQNVTATTTKVTSYQRVQQEKEARIKAQMAAAEEARQAEMLVMAKRAADIQRKADEKKKAIAAIAADWKAQIMAIVTQVKGFRAANPGINGINAGDNRDIGTTEGGNKNPLRLDLPLNDHNIEKSEVFALFGKAFDGSDSAELKIRILDAAGNILIHVR